MNWYPLVNFTHYSLLKGFSKPAELAKICSDNDYPACGIADYKTISGCVSFFQSCRKSGIKPILGCSFDNNIIFSKNKDGWYDLIELVSSLDEDGSINRDFAISIVKKKNLISVTSGDIKPTYYTKQSQADLHRILLCSEAKTTLPKIQKSIKKKDLDPILLDYFTHDNKYIIEGKNSALLQEIYEQCEEYDILNKPMLPKFSCPDGLSEEEYLKVLARKGWKELLINTGKVKDPLKKQQYSDRFNTELQVIKDANLFG